MARLLKHMHWAAYDVLWLATFVDLDAVPENDESTKLAMNTLSDTYFGVTGWQSWMKMVTGYTGITTSGQSVKTMEITNGDLMPGTRSTPEKKVN
ncbi:hypothetical protein [Methanohalophilus sp. DAL1]|uniref:hypothetical protein n=1 Tax=Methanohalophilus sp. DAL1 TaxID=1864608 RepID=UPI000817E66E|nr:hypothetical protein [Methanohalophilus sp. DAL1]OBZ35684.1 MAG: hypothetical protein A9957_06495 [Methanohalophilus sp. DAL1]